MVASSAAWRIGSAQSVGGRSRQEDRLSVQRRSDGLLLLAVADGAGGHDDGEKASATAIDCLERAFANATAAGAGNWLAEALAAADRAVAGLGQGPTAPRTTIVAAVIDAGGKAQVGHVGDSRLYHLRDGGVAFRTRDHSIVQLLLDMGRLKEGEIASHPDRSRLLKALGGGDQAADVTTLALAPGDGLALCSDGVWEHVEARQFWVALDNPELDRAAEAVVAQAVERGGRTADNATLILARWR